MLINSITLESTEFVRLIISGLHLMIGVRGFLEGEQADATVLV